MVSTSRILWLGAVVAVLFGILWEYWGAPKPSFPTTSLAPSPTQTRLTLFYPEVDIVNDDFELDIIAVHGLGTSSPKTWIKYEETPFNGTPNRLRRPVNWLSDTRMLPSWIPKAKIWSFDYDSNWYSHGPAQRLLPLAETMLHVIGNTLMDNRTTPRPVIFIGSSFGGLVVATALERASQMEGANLRVLQSTVGVVFLGTPIRGTKYASAIEWINLVSGLLDKKPSNSLTRDLDGHSPVLNDHIHRFSSLIRQKAYALDIRCFFEQQKTKILRLRKFCSPKWTWGDVLLVPEMDSCIDGFPKHGLDVGHTMLNKFSGPDDAKFKLVAGVIRELASNAAKALVARREESPSYTIIPFPRNPDFTDFNGAIPQLNKKLGFVSTRQSAALWGIGGSGKTQIALEYAYRRQAKTGCSVFWVQAGSYAKFVLDYSELAKAVGITIGPNTETVLKDVRVWLEKQQNYLLVLDGADDLRLFSPNSQLSDANQDANLLQFLPTGNSGTILLASQDEAVVHHVVGADEIVRVLPLTETDAVQLLQKYSGAGEDEWGTLKVAVLSGSSHLPLEIFGVGSYLRTTGLSAYGYWQLLESTKERTKSLKMAFPSRYRPANTPSSLFNTWQLTLERIAQESPLSRRVLDVLSFYDPDEISFALIHAAAGLEYSVDEVLLAAGRLKDFGILHIRRNRLANLPTYGIHQLYHATIKDLLLVHSSQGQYDVSLSLATEILFQAFRDCDTESVVGCTTYIPHILNVMSQRWDKISPHLIDLLEKAETFLAIQGRWREAMFMREELLKICFAEYGNSHPRTTEARASLAEIYVALGRSLDAECLSLQAIEQLDFTKGKSLEVINRFEQSSRRLIEDADMDLNWTKRKVGWLVMQNSNGDPADKQEWLTYIDITIRQSVHLSKLVPLLPESRKYDDDRWVFVVRVGDLPTVVNLARSYFQQDRLPEAEDLLYVISIYQTEILGPGHEDTLSTIDSAVNLMMNRGDFDRAEERQKEVLEYRSKSDDFLAYVADYVSFGKIQYHRGNYVKAEEILREGLVVFQKEYGENHPLILRTKAWLCASLAAQGRLEEPQSIYHDIIPAFGETLGSRHPLTLTTLEDLAILLFVKKDYLEAENTLQDCLKAWKLEHGNLHPGTQLSMEKLAILYDALGRHEEADKLASEAITLREERMEKNAYTSLAITDYRRNLALHVAYMHDIEDKGAENLAVRLWNMRNPRVKLQARDYWIVQMMEETALIYSKTCRTKNAVKIMKMALEWRTEYMGVADCWTTKTERMYEYVKARRQERILDIAWYTSKVYASYLIAMFLVGAILWWFGWIQD